ncbi:Protein yippee-like [Linum grandiflorum]
MDEYELFGVHNSLDILDISLGRVRFLTTYYACIFSSLSTPGMGKLTSSVRCKFSLVSSTISFFITTVNRYHRNAISFARVKIASFPQISLLLHLVVCLFTCFHRVNVSMGEKEERLMMTGKHTVADIFCVGCGSIVGWKYETAHEKSQKYKEGKSVLERFKVSGPDGSSYWVNHEAHVGGSDADDV